MSMTTLATTDPALTQETGLKLIVWYKLARSGIAFIGGTFAIVLMATGLGPQLQHHAEAVRDAGASAAAIRIAEAVLDVLQKRHLWWVAGALLLDSGVLLLEGWALHRGLRWGVLLVVAASACLVPFEIYALFRHVSVLRIAVLAINGLIVWWLWRHAIHHHRKTSRPEPPRPIVGA